MAKIMTKKESFDLIDSLKENYGINEEILLKELADFISAKTLEEFLKDFLRMRDMEEMFPEWEDED